MGRRIFNIIGLDKYGLARGDSWFDWTKPWVKSHQSLRDDFILMCQLALEDNDDAKAYLDSYKRRLILKRLSGV